MNADDNTLKAPGDPDKKCLLKSYVLLNLNNLCIYCKVLKSVTVNCWKKRNHLCKSCGDNISLLLHTSLLKEGGQMQILQKSTQRQFISA